MARPLALSALLAALTANLAATAAAESPVEVREAERELAHRIEVVLPERDEPQSQFEAERIAEEAAARASAFLRSEGYYSSQVTPGADATPSAWIVVDAGPLFRFAAPKLDFEGAAPDLAVTAAAQNGLGAVRADAAARAADVLAAEAAALTALKEAGFADARVAKREVVVDHATNRATATFRFVTGERARLGAVRVAPERTIRPDLAQSMAPWTPGEQYTPDKLIQLRRNATSTGVFASASARLEETPNADGNRDVVLTLERLPPRTIELGVGYSSADGAGGDAEWTRRNASRRAETLTLGTTISEQQQSLRGELAYPHGGGIDRTVHYTVQAIREDAGPYDRDAVSAAWSIDAQPRRRFALSYGLSGSADFYSGAAGVENAYILSSFGDLRAETTDSRLDARKGHRLEGRVEPAVSFGDATVPFVRSTAEARIFETPDFAPRLTFAARAKGGWVTPIGGQGQNLPLDRLFYAGGGGSVRGYAYNTIFPEDVDRSTQPPGGRGLVEVSGEARARIGRQFGVAAFLDGGAAFNSLDQAADLKWGAGIGVRYDLGFAPLRFDIAAPLNPRPTDDSIAFYLSIGQAF
ncbi:MAG: BamA/TamA family outer membrane protein [Hyphomonadaceae bacterium]|nr:BamA/TamA family outer membrane protein [Hyphomonadaceae bacterium]